MLGSADLVAFVASGDLVRSHDFYGGALGLELVESSAFANAYDVGGTQLRVTHVTEVVAPPHTVLGWRVRDIAEAMRALRGAGITFLSYAGFAQDEHLVWTAPGGSRVAWFVDPDRNTLSVQQAPALTNAETTVR